jgi:hypothetical protein
MEHGKLIEATATTTNSSGCALAGSHSAFTQLISYGFLPFCYS